MNRFPPSCNWVKCNTDGAAKAAPETAGCGRIFRGHTAEILGCYEVNIGISCALIAELIDVMFTIEVAYNKGLD